MLEVGAKLFAVLFLDAERGENGHDGLQDDCIDIVAMKSLLLGKRLHDDGPDILIMERAHRLIILATFSKPRLAK